MARRIRKPSSEAEPDVPPGATRRAWDREVEPTGGPEGSGAGPRHAADDVGTEAESYDDVDDTRSLAGPPVEAEDPLETGPPYSGRAGGAVGGTPAQKRSSLKTPRAATPPSEPAPVPPRIGPSGSNLLRLTGFEAIEFAEKQNLKLNKHPDAVTGPRVGLSIAEARALAADDPDQIWLDVPEADYYEGPPTSYEPDR